MTNKRSFEFCQYKKLLNRNSEVVFQTSRFEPETVNNLWSTYEELFEDRGKALRSTNQRNVLFQFFCLNLDVFMTHGDAIVRYIYLSLEQKSGDNPMRSTWQSFYFSKWTEKLIFNFQKHKRESAFFETSKTFIVRAGGDQKGPSILLKIAYSNKQSPLVPNMASKIVCGN